ncbi:MAG: UDP-N-acetyl-D-mannosamine dehydrogenase [Alteromonadaceae bacterium]|nr:UDP-N-acetyl-D-mannosamine dehydrogenase [Alteromonadaceae bacterium]
MSFETISIIGLGYIGLPTAAMFASRKKKVIGVDVNQHAIDTINRGEIHIVEPDLDIIVHAAVSEGYLRATNTAEPADAFLIAVPTPFKDSDSKIPQPDLKYIESAAKSIAPVLKKGDLIILESTSPVGATEQLADWLAEIRSDLSFPQTAGEQAEVNIAHCPERVLPGHVVRELVENDRVIGGMSSKCSEKAIELYKTFVKGECFVTNARTAEMAKLTENSCRDLQIAFANELSMICDKLDIDVWELITLANRHPRINILQPGPGVGGHCIAVDPWFIVSKTPSEAKMIHMARETNEYKTEWVIKKIQEEINLLLKNNFDKKRKDVTVACFGLSFKPNIDDLRESPALKITKTISKNHPGKVIGVEPNIDGLNDNLIELNKDIEKLDYDIAVFLVKHKEFEGYKRKEDKKYIDLVGLFGNEVKA